jgi:hypothetical protein
MSKPIGSVHVEDRGKHAPSPKDLLRESPPPDPKDGLTQDDATRIAEDAAQRERASSTPSGMPPGTIAGARVPGNNKCGAKYGRCFGQVVNGVCESCGHDYRPPPARYGENGRF